MKSKPDLTDYEVVLAAVRRTLDLATARDQAAQIPGQNEELIARGLDALPFPEIQPDEESVCVCLPCNRTFRLLEPDNELGICADCTQPIQFRPTSAQIKVIRLCPCCALARMVD